MVSVRRPQRTFGLPAAWWPIAFGDEVSSRPRAYRLGGRRLALFRDGGGAVRAVEDICPHRRLPLSMGRLTGEGYLQCGYHGWCFDGASGQCVAIPNFDVHERVSPSIRVPAFNTAEGDLPTDQALTMFDAALADGFVHVWTGTEPAESVPATTPMVRSSRGDVEVRAPYERVAEALLWNPGRALGLGLLLGEGEEVVDADVEECPTTIDARRERLALDLPRPSTFEPLVRRAVPASITTRADTGFTHVAVPGARVTVGLTPTGSYRTVVRWSVELEDSGGSRRRTSLAAARLVRTVRHPVRGVAGAIEAVADDVEDSVDAAVDRLRAVRDVRVDA